jgi:5'-3' exonuclease
LLALVRERDVTHVGCAFDTVIESFRNELFEGYKTGEGIEPALLAQFHLAERAARSLGIVVWSMIEFEADDALATAAARWKNAPDVEQIVICSPDKDLAQCVEGKQVVTWDRRRNIVRGEDDVVDKFGVRPKSIPDWLALVGDSADGIPGVPGWGKKSSALLLYRYSRLEDIPDDPGDWDIDVSRASHIASTLSNRRQDVQLYRQLATLRTDVPLVEDLEDLRWNGPNQDELEALCEEIGDDDFPSYLSPRKKQ